MAQLFSRSKVPQLEKVISRHVMKFVDKMRISDSIVDLSVASRSLEADIMCKIKSTWLFYSLVNIKIADFSFGTTINALDSWASGEQLAMVEKNDEKATWMPVVSLPQIHNIHD